MPDLKSTTDRLSDVETSRMAMLHLFDEAGYSDLGTALDVYVQNLMRLNGDEYHALQDLLRSNRA